MFDYRKFRERKDGIDAGVRNVEERPPVIVADYTQRMGYDRSPETSDPRMERAFETALETRRFEIDLYWKRATYFWGFSIVALGAYALVVRGEADGRFSVVLIACVGLLVSLCWWAVNIGSKAWQENWERDVDQLEDAFTGPLYEAVFTGQTYSMSRANILISLVLRPCGPR